MGLHHGGDDAAEIVAALGGAGSAPIPLRTEARATLRPATRPRRHLHLLELITTHWPGDGSHLRLPECSQLVISTQPAAPGGSHQNTGLTTQRSARSRSPSREQTPAACTLHIHVRANYLDFFGSPQAASQIGMIQGRCSPAPACCGAEPAAVVRPPSSPFVGRLPRHVLDIDLDTVCGDPPAARIQAVDARRRPKPKACCDRKGLKIKPRAEKSRSSSRSELLRPPPETARRARSISRATRGGASKPARGRPTPGLSAIRRCPRARMTASVRVAKIRRRRGNAPASASRRAAQLGTLAHVDGEGADRHQSLPRQRGSSPRRRCRRPFVAR